jgi:integrase/recombinase XerD
MATVPRPRVRPPQPRLPLVLEEVSALCSAAASWSFTCRVISTLLETGLRVFEVWCLRPGDLDTKAGLLHVRHGKGAERRSVKLGERYLRLLRRYWGLEGPGREWLFPAQRLVVPGRIDSQHR